MMTKKYPLADLPSIISIEQTATTTEESCSSSSLKNESSGSDCYVNNNNHDRKTLRKRKKKKQSLREVYLDERSREKSKVPSVAPVTEDSFSIDSRSNKDNHSNTAVRQWNKAYVPLPLVQSTILVSISVFIITVAILWPLILLVLFAIAIFLVSYCFRENDFAGSRRKLYQQFINDGKDSLPRCFLDLLNCREGSLLSSYSSTPNTDFKMVRSQSGFKLKFQDGYWRNSRGMLLHTVIMTPTNQPIKAVLCYCHGYTDNVSYMKLASFSRFVEAGVALIAIEYEGHGLSDGLMCYINDWNLVIDDVTAYFLSILTTEKCLEHRPPAFLVGESMGGAIAYDVYNRLNLFKGVIFISPMCKISDDMLPSPFIIDCLKRLLEVCPWIGYLPLAPSKANLDDVCYKVETKRIEASLAPLNYSRSPRLATARELIDATQRISETFCDFDAPFLIVHGKADVVTDPNLSQQLFDESQSVDKTIKLYDGMWHSLLGGEPDKNVDLVMNDLFKWMKERSC